MGVDPKLSIGLTGEEEKFRREARDFADRELAPIADEIDRSHEIPDALVRKLGERGYMGMLVPKKYGGSEKGNFLLSVLQMEINRVCAATGVMMSVHNSLGGGPLTYFGTEDQQKRYSPKIASGEWIAAYSLTEPEAGSDAASLQCAAVRDGDEYVLNGTKNFVSNGIAGLFTVFARTDPDASKARGITAFLIERDTKGFTIGKPEEKMGIRGSTTVSLFLDDCRVPAKNLLGRENQGFRIAMALLDGGRIGIASQAIGITQACLDASVEHAKTNDQVARSQCSQWTIADMAADLDAAKLLVYRAARLRDAGLPHTKEASMAKLFAAEMANRHAANAVEIHGSAGVIGGMPVERFFRDAKITQIYEGTSEVQRIVISRQLLS
jgi:alkylation response protein AidB-like acyl-CoA dehydrogenase